MTKSKKGTPEASKSVKTTSDTKKEKQSIVGQETPVKSSADTKETAPKKASTRKATKKKGEPKALYYSNRLGNKFQKLDKQISLKDLQSRKHTVATELDSVFLMSDGSVFSVKENKITNQNLSAELQILKSQK